MDVVLIIAVAWVLVRGMHLGFPLAKRLVEAAAHRVEQGGAARPYRGSPGADAGAGRDELEDAVRLLAADVEQLREQQAFLEKLLEGGTVRASGVLVRSSPESAAAPPAPLQPEPPQPAPPQPAPPQPEPPQPEPPQQPRPPSPVTG
jgi:hypothetical protein